MAENDVDVVRRCWDSFLRGDVTSALSTLHEDVEWDGTNLPDGRVGHGHAAVVDHVLRWAGMWKTWTIEPQEFIDAGDGRVIVTLHERGRSETGAEVDEVVADLYDVRDGKIARRQAFATPDEVFEAVGLGGRS